MKKVLLILSTFFIMMIYSKAIEEIPSNIYYIDNGLYAYLEESNIDYSSEDTKLYIEYRLIKEDTFKDINLIEITTFPAKNLILEETDDFYSEDLEISARYVLVSSEYDYSEWSEKAKIEDFSFTEMPKLTISSLDETLKFKDNFGKIKEYFKNYIKIKEEKLNYIVEYKVNDSAWTDQKPSDIDFNDIKIEVRAKYEIGEHKSEYSNILIYEKHPEKTCPFDSDICCNEFAGFSVCYWFLIISVIFTLFFIFLDRKKRLNREA